jgi:hypothetical protein
MYNNCTISFRTAIFIVNAIIAWTCALHAYFLKHMIRPIYVKDGSPVKTPEGEEKYWDLSECLQSKQSPLTAGEANNLKYLLLLRHEIEHRLARDIDETVQPKVHACTMNFSEFCEKEFGHLG